MSAIITADTHWNDHPRDESRWGLFDWLAEQQADELIILGDLTVAKNNHPARMVNRLVDGFIKLSQNYQKIYILKGNHDYVDPNCPFFGFLAELPKILFIPNVMSLETTIGNWLFMPAGTDWAEHKELLWDRNVFAHVSFDGALSETGYQLTGVNPRIVLDAKARVISGDVHKPQYLANGAIEYVGAPYHCHFGDDFTPRILRMENNTSRSELHYPSPRKFSQVITSLAELDRIAIKAGDQIKIIVQMRRADLPDWKQWRDAIREKAEQEGWVLFGPELKLQQDALVPRTNETIRQSHEQLITEYTTRQKASELHQRIGQELLKAARG